MTDRTNGGSPVVYPQQYHTVPTAVIDGARLRDRYLNSSEIAELSTFLSTGLQRLEIAQVLADKSDKIVAAGAKRIFVGGNPMSYFEPPREDIGLPGSGYFVGEDYLLSAERGEAIRAKATQSKRDSRPVDSDKANSIMVWLRGLFYSGKPSVPTSFRAINIRSYGPVRMKRSMRDLGWFLRYITYAIIAGDTSIISVNTKGLRGVIPEDVTLATSVALREMQWKSLSFFPSNSPAAALVKQYFNVLIDDYQVEQPADQLRTGVSVHHQGLQIPSSYEESSTAKPRWVMKPGLPDIEKEAVVQAAFRQVFERDISPPYDQMLTELISQVKRDRQSMKEFVRQLGKSRLYRQLYYEPYSVSRSIELACRHFIGRGPSCLEEFQTYFELVSDKGYLALIDALIDSQEYAEYFGEESVPFLRELGQEAQECRNWGPQINLFKYSAPVRKVPQFLTTFAGYQQPLPNQHPYGTGNDPLETQFGAIFPQDNKNPKAQPAHFTTASRRILISPYRAQPSSAHASLEAVILATYRQVFGREVLPSQRHIVAETQFRDARISVKGLVRELAKSKTFRREHWETLYVTKSVEIIHRRLLGRPTRDRQELNKYYDICGYQGFYALIDAIINSPEYQEVFGEDTIPYERLTTPKGVSARSPKGPVAWSKPRENPLTVGDYMMTYQPTEKSAFTHSSQYRPQENALNSHDDIDHNRFKPTASELETTENRLPDEEPAPPDLEPALTPEEDRAISAQAEVS